MRGTPTQPPLPPPPEGFHVQKKKAPKNILTEMHSKIINIMSVMFYMKIYLLTNILSVLRQIEDGVPGCSAVNALAKRIRDQ